VLSASPFQGYFGGVGAEDPTAYLSPAGRVCHQPPPISSAGGTWCLPPCPPPAVDAAAPNDLMI